MDTVTPTQASPGLARRGRPPSRRLSSPGPRPPPSSLSPSDGSRQRDVSSESASVSVSLSARSEPVPLPNAQPLEKYSVKDRDIGSAPATSHASPTPSFKTRLASGLHWRTSERRSHGHREERSDEEDARRLQRMKERVGLTVKGLVDTLLPVVSDIADMVAVPGLGLAAGVLQSIWENAQIVESNQWKCVGLTERCANLLLLLSRIVRDSGPDVAFQMQAPMETITHTFTEIAEYFQQLAHMGTIQRYLARDEIKNEIEQYHHTISDQLQLFNTSVRLTFFLYCSRFMLGILLFAGHTLRLNAYRSIPDTGILEGLPSGSMLLAPPSLASPFNINKDGLLAPLEDDPIPGLPMIPSAPQLTYAEPLPAVASDHTVASLKKELHRRQPLETQREHELDEVALLREIESVRAGAGGSAAEQAETILREIPKEHIHAVMTLLLAELEKQTPAGGPVTVASGYGAGRTLAGRRAPTTSNTMSPSPHIRALTWPLDGLLARQASLEHEGFSEEKLEELKRTVQALKMPPPPPVMSVEDAATILRGSVTRKHRINIYSPSNHATSVHTSDSFGTQEPWQTDTAATTPAKSGFADLPAAEESVSDFDEAEIVEVNPVEVAQVARALLTVPLYTPTYVSLGAVGYLKKPDGVFMTLFNSADPGAAGFVGVAPLIGVHDLEVREKQPHGGGSGVKQIFKAIKQRLRRSNSASASSLKSSESSLRSQSESHQKNRDAGVSHSYNFSAFGGTAHLITEEAEYAYWSSLETPRRWFRANIDAILKAVPGNALLKQEIFLVYGTVNARDHAMLINHGDTEE
ncbi:hypothetical protein HMN09_00862000 [Mycena chlorophos]|uniref:Uncharacterized protein n=1 Tax=Mycena chlorophos TaxID=658473 RepID=A0A8H6W3R9_MYCCL|nr:hypothetical protein HMN09_00862000 [Mycena chlorophos]